MAIRGSPGCLPPLLRSPWIGISRSAGYDASADSATAFNDHQPIGPSIAALVGLIIVHTAQLVLRLPAALILGRRVPARHFGNMTADRELPRTDELIGIKSVTRRIKVTLRFLIICCDSRLLLRRLSRTAANQCE